MGYVNGAGFGAIDCTTINFVVHGDDYLQEYQEEVYKPIEMGIFRVAPYVGGISTTEIIRTG